MEGVTTCGNSWQIYYSTDDAWQAMYKACSDARHSIKIEQYIFEDDPCGRLFLELFIKKAAQGVQIFMLCDMFGSKSLYNSPLINKLKELNGECCFYNKNIWQLIPSHCFPRTHIKTLLVDSAIAFTGGVCLADRMKGWRDTHIRIAGPVASQIEKAFYSIKNQVRFNRVFSYSKTIMPDQGCCDYVESDPSIFRHKIYKTYKAAILAAKEEIYISTSFFVPNRRFMNLLRRTCRRGVKIYLLVPEYSDVQLADWIFLSYAKALLKAGIKIYCYQRNVLHCKTMVVDNNWAIIGSANMDILSFFYNREASLICTDPALAEELKRQFHIDVNNSQELNFENLAQRPLQKKLLGFLGRGLKLFLPRDR